jgi:hypothetical protein
MRTGFVAICLTFILGFSNAWAKTYLGSGLVSCGQWLDGEKQGVRNLHLNWVLGYLSGLNLTSQIDFLREYEHKGIAAAIDKYCRENPLKQVIDAADDVAEQMKRMKR